LLEDAVKIIIERYTDTDNITDTLSNLYLRVEQEQYIPVFQKMIARAKELYPAHPTLESLHGFMNIKGKDYSAALESFTILKDQVERDIENPYFNHMMAIAWDNIADCHLKLGDAEKTIESCEKAFVYELKSEELKVGNSILYKKSEAHLLAGDKEAALAIVSQILEEDEADETALQIKNKIQSN
jgi:tetratricopeptide (TPR) repeat protein